MRFSANDARNPHNLAIYADNSLQRFRIATERRDPAIAFAVLNPLVSVPFKKIKNHGRPAPRSTPCKSGSSLKHAGRARGLASFGHGAIATWAGRPDR